MIRFQRIRSFAMEGEYKEMIPDAQALHAEVLVGGKRYTSYCIEEFRSDEIPCSYTCRGENSGKIRQIKQIRARDITGEEVSSKHDLWMERDTSWGMGEGFARSAKGTALPPSPLHLRKNLSAERHHRNPTKNLWDIFIVKWQRKIPLFRRIFLCRGGESDSRRKDFP
ncbi:hypothetical protein HYW94_02365 [Candidatus Uhrbacteria bacterium]|nr:hypothetical protein [Candidatus Uhrbacteria bacterium]